MIRGPIKILLYPFSLLFGLIVGIRNYLYNNGILKKNSFDIPIIVIGNLAVGGTGKTPHTEYLIGLLGKKFRVAVLSRGYRRKTKGFILANENSTATEIGDEPSQIKSKFPELIVAVDAKRSEGIKKIMEAHPETDVILLDDAFQHRKVDPGLSILVTDFNKRFSNDFLMPFGSLREHRINSRRADYILVSKSPLDLTPIDMRVIVGEIPPLSHQHLYFTSTVYKEPVPFFADTPEPLCLSKIAETNRNVLLITGIASPEYLYNYIAIYSKKIVHLNYPDHHYFTRKDFADINREYEKLTPGNRCIITTEKDAARLKEIPDIANLSDKGVYYIPIGVSFLNNDAEEFNNFITEYVTTNRSNSQIPQR